MAEPRPGIRVSESYVEEHPDADPAATELVVNLLATAGLVLGRMDELLRPFDLTTSSFNLLVIVAGDPEPLTPSEIASRFPVPVTTATTTGLLHTCERRGLVERRPHPGDRRSVLVHLTPRGRKVLADVQPLVAQAERLWTGPLAAGERRRVTTALGTLYDHLRELPR
jgi:DNA-binding MarR family transcriptional regulator